MYIAKALLLLAFTCASGRRLKIHRTATNTSTIPAATTDTSATTATPASTTIHRIVDVTKTIAVDDAAGKVRCCCDINLVRSAERTGMCVLVKGFTSCTLLPRTSWANGILHHYKKVGGVCWLPKDRADKVQEEFMPPDSDQSKFKLLEKIGRGFWNIRAPFQMYGVEVGTHMSLAQLADGNFVAIDTIDLAIPGMKEEIDLLTDSGQKLVAVLGTHPFHTIYFPAFAKAYPSAAERAYFGTSRHLRNQPEVGWTGNITSVFDKWPELEMVLPDGGEFDAPEPESYNHLMNVFVFHQQSKTVHNNDCVEVFHWGRLNWKGRVLGASGVAKWLRPGMTFHPSLTGPGLSEASNSPAKFKASIERVLDWDFENLCTAHNGNSVGDARGQLRQLLADTESTFNTMTESRRQKEIQLSGGNWSDKPDGNSG